MAAHRPPSLSRVRIPAGVALSAAFILLGVTIAGPAAATEPPIAAPGGEVPKHAQGGWPTALTDQEDKPKRSPEQQKHLDSVATELKRIANTHGPDSVVLQAKFLMRSMAAGAIGPTEVRVVGPSTGPAGPDHLEIDVETGIYFSGKLTTPETRRDIVWKEVVMPVLDEMVSFKIEPASLDLVFLFDVQDEVATVEQLDPTAAARHEAFRVRLGRPMLEEMIDDTIVGDAVREKAELSPAVTVERVALPTAR